jgi:hypothetical protein
LYRDRTGGGACVRCVPELAYYQQYSRVLKIDTEMTCYKLYTVVLQIDTELKCYTQYTGVLKIDTEMDTCALQNSPRIS